MFGFKLLMAKMLFDEVLSAVLNSKNGICNHEEKLQTISFFLLAVYSLLSQSSTVLKNFSDFLPSYKSVMKK